MTKKFKSDKKADFFLSEVIRQRGRLNNAVLRREKYNIIASIKESYDVNQLFSSKVPNYKTFASVYKLFEGIEEMVEETLIKNSPPRNQEECSERLRALFQAIEKKHGYTADDAMRDIKKYLN